MAEYDPAGQGAAWGENEGYGVADGNQQEHTQHSTQQETAEYSVDIARNAPGDGSSHDGPADDVGDHDPASVQSAPEHEPIPQTAEALAPVKPSKQAAAKKPRTAGGFLVGDSDSEDDEEPVPASSGPAQGSVTQSSISQSSLRQSKAAKEHDGAPSNTFPASQANVAAAAPTKSLGNGAVGSPAPGAAGGSASQAPPDRLASLEARVSDDPRGALDEWLSLIAEYRARNNLAEIRQVYERFLVVFPQAVSQKATKVTLVSTLTTDRLIFGPLIWTSS
jgi:cleavage stimulation factor subunit 3